MEDDSIVERDYLHRGKTGGDVGENWGRPQATAQNRAWFCQTLSDFIIIVGRRVPGACRLQMMISIPTSPYSCFYTTREKKKVSRYVSAKGETVPLMLISAITIVTLCTIIVVTGLLQH